MSEPEPEESEELGESDGMSERTAKLILASVALAALAAIVIVFPYVAYFVTGILACRGWQKTRDWIGRRRSDEDDGGELEAEEVDVVEALHYLGRGGRNVLLTELRDETGAADTKVVRALLDEAGVPVRPGVRTPAGNGPGVHARDVPPLSPAESGLPGGRCSCSSAANTNTNNAPEPAPGEGLRVEPIGQAGTVIHHPADAVRHHQIGK